MDYYRDQWYFAQNDLFMIVIRIVSDNVSHDVSTSFDFWHNFFGCVCFCGHPNMKYDREIV